VADEPTAGPASAAELAAVRWLEQVVRARDVGLDRYAPAALRAAIEDEQNEEFTVLVPIGTIRHLLRYVHRLKARGLA
jgi:hypothetical protein